MMPSHRAKVGLSGVVTAMMLLSSAAVFHKGDSGLRQRVVDGAASKVFDRSAQRPVADDPIVYVTENGNKYHRDGCHHLKKSRIPRRLSEARKRFSPCPDCAPPE
jgi:hypothetical protein